MKVWSIVAYAGFIGIIVYIVYGYIICMVCQDLPRPDKVQRRMGFDGGARPQRKKLYDIFEEANRIPAVGMKFPNT